MSTEHESNPQYSNQIIAAAKTSFLKGDQWAYLAGIITVLLGATLVFFAFPKKEDEERLLTEYRKEDEGQSRPTAGLRTRTAPPRPIPPMT